MPKDLRTLFFHFWVYPVAQHNAWDIAGTCYLFGDGLPRWLSGKESACQCRRRKRHWFDPWFGKIPWSRKWQPAPVFLPGKSMDRGAWRATVLGVARSWTGLSVHTYNTQTHTDTQTYTQTHRHTHTLGRWMNQAQHSLGQIVSELIC